MWEWLGCVGVLELVLLPEGFVWRWVCEWGCRKGWGFCRVGSLSRSLEEGSLRSTRSRSRSWSRSREEGVGPGKILSYSYGRVESLK